MARQIPFPAGPSWEQEVQLDGRAYVLRGRWNTRFSAWTLDVLTRDEEPLILGARIVIGIGLLQRAVDERLPAGEILCVNVTGSTRRDPGRDAFDEDFRLIYLSEDEVNAV